MCIITWCQVVPCMDMLLQLIIWSVISNNNMYTRVIQPEYSKDIAYTKMYTCKIIVGKTHDEGLVRLS